jgi:hypothetical protein
VNKDVVISALCLGRTAIVGLADALEALGHSVDNELNQALIEIDRLVSSYKDIL